MSMLHSVGIWLELPQRAIALWQKHGKKSPSPTHCRRFQLPVLSMSHLQHFSTQLPWTLMARLIPPDSGDNLTATLP